jgi:hypothetical protein
VLSTQKSKLKTQNSKLKTQNSKLKTQNSKLKTQNSNSIKSKIKNQTTDQITKNQQPSPFRAVRRLREHKIK